MNEKEQLNYDRGIYETMRQMSDDDIETARKLNAPIQMKKPRTISEYNGNGMHNRYSRYLESEASHACEDVNKSLWARCVCWLRIKLS